MSARTKLVDRLNALSGFPHLVLGGRMRACIAALYDELAVSGYRCVIMPANVCPTLITAIQRSGTEILLTPTNPETGAMSDDAAASLVSASPTLGTVMLVQSYGFRRDYPQTVQAAREKGWLVIENDTMATCLSPETGALGSMADVLLSSFGAGKAVSAGFGGVAFFRDRGLYEAVERRVHAFPPLEDVHARRDDWLIQARRLLRQGPPKGGSWLKHGEFLMALEQEDLCHSLPDTAIDDILTALDQAPGKHERSRTAAACWTSALQEVGGIYGVEGKQVNPWRSMWLVPKGRDRVAENLRKAGFDAGTNYPDVREYFPTVLTCAPDAGARQWTETVLNLWVDDRYDRERIEKAASVIEASLGLTG